MLSLRQYTPVVICTLLVLTVTAAQARPHSDLASFYSSGRVTASGEKFDKAALKAAHLSLPFGSIVKVVNKRNGKSVVVEINDRGPAKWTRRTIDLTRGAARVIGMVKRGVVPVRLEVAHVTRPQLDRAFVKLARLIEAREAAEAAYAEVTAEPTAQAVPACRRGGDRDHTAARTRRQHLQGLCGEPDPAGRAARATELRRRHAVSRAAARGAAARRLGIRYSRGGDLRVPAAIATTAPSTAIAAGPRAATLAMPPSTSAAGRPISGSPA